MEKRNGIGAGSQGAEEHQSQLPDRQGLFVQRVGGHVPVACIGTLVDACPEGEPIFRGISRAAVLAALRRLLGEIGVADAGLYGTHDLRRGHALDLQLSKAPLWKILDAGGWRSPAFLKYLDMQQLDRDLVVQAHIAESSSD